MAAKWIARVLVDLGELQRGRIDDGGVTVGAGEIERIIRRDFVELFARRKLRRFPKCFDPAAAGNPFAALGIGYPLLYFGEKLVKRVCPFEIQIHLALADSENVAMRVGQTGYDGFAGKIDDTGGVKFLRVVV